MRNSLARFIPQSNADEGQIRAMRAAAWHKHGYVCVWPDDVPNEFERQAVINAAVRLYGKRDGAV